MSFTPEKRSIYTYRRKEDGHLYYISYPHSAIIEKSKTFMSMATNPFWEVIKVEKDNRKPSVKNSANF